MQKRREAGGSTLAALVVLLALGGLGAWNYQRNVEAEAGVYRPFRTHSDEELAQLAAALDGEKERVTARYDDAAARRATPRERGRFDEQVREFERVQRAGAAKNAVRAELAVSTTTLKLLADEERMRAGERDAMLLFFKRLLTI